MIKIPNTSPAFRLTQNKESILRIKEEIKYIHIKKNYTDTVSALW
jgi:hypothetical protein